MMADAPRKVYIDWVRDRSGNLILSSYGLKSPPGPNAARYVTSESVKGTERQRDRLLEVVKAAAVMPWGYCLCPPRMGDMEGADNQAHCGECRDVRGGNCTRGEI